MWPAVIAGASQVLSAAAGRPAAPAVSGGTVNSWLDNSGWTVATGSASARGGDRDQAQAAGLPFSPWLIAAALVGLAIFKKFGDE
ncbi:MAG: hypothetical protein ACT4PS_08720 [Betaproteobacteria bacterium]